MEFRDINDMNEFVLPLPSEAVKIDGQFLDEILDGFRTISVSGRDLVIRNLRTTGNISGRDGEIFLGSDLPSRLIRVQYKLKSSNATEFAQRFDALKSLLFSNKLRREIGFNDEEFIYYGYASSINEVAEGLLDVVGTFEILCVNPYKYSELKTLNGGGSPAVVNIVDDKYLGFSIELEEIVFTPSANQTKITLVNSRTGKRIIINGNYTSGQAIRFVFQDVNRIYSGVNDITNQLAFEVSSYHDFDVQNGDTITFTGIAGTIQVKYRSKRL